MDATVFYSKELGVRYFTYRQGSASRFVLLDDGDTLRRKNHPGRAAGHHPRQPAGMLTLAEVRRHTATNLTGGQDALKSSLGKTSPAGFFVCDQR